MISHPFIEKFKLLEKKMRDIGRSSDREPFWEVLNSVEKVNYLIKSKKDILQDLNALRNIFVHSDREKYIAEVNDIAYNELANIIKLLDTPPVVGQVFNKDVYWVNTDEILEKVIHKMQESIYTHVPVYKDGKYWGVFSETSLLNWLVENINEGKADFYKPQMINVKREYLHCASNIVKFIPVSKSIFDIPEMFNLAISKNQRLGAIIITEKGTKEELPKGIITAWDIPLIDDYIKRYT